jgi:hypothetical protein
MGLLLKFEVLQPVKTMKIKHFVVPNCPFCNNKVDIHLELTWKYFSMYVLQHQTKGKSIC